MPHLTCFRLNPTVLGVRATDLDDFIDAGEYRVVEYGPIEGQRFVAKLYVVESFPHDPRWAPFLRSGFGGDLRLPRASSPAALLLLRVQDEPEDDGEERPDLFFGFPFGIAGRHLLRFESICRTYGLRAALNIIYATPEEGEETDPSRVRGIDAKRRGPTTVRSRSQSSEAAAFEIFGVDTLRDVVNAATGVPQDPDTWGSRVTGADALTIDIHVDLEDLGELCLLIEDAHSQTDYVANFGWIDDIRPVVDPDLRARLEALVLEQMADELGGGLELAPPELIDWERVASFHYHYDRRTGDASAVTHPELRIRDYLGGAVVHGLGPVQSIATLRSRKIEAVDASGVPVHRWSLWRCLVGEFIVDDETFVLDEGEFFSVSHDYLGELNAFVDRRLEAFEGLPTADVRLHEKDYNAAVAEGSTDFFLLDRKNVVVPGRTTAVEVCDLLGKNHEMVHVKRHLGSSQLSHLFSQGFVSAELLYRSAEFRRAVHDKVVDELGAPDEFHFFGSSINPVDFTIVFAVIADWRGRAPSEALPFFSKVNLRHFVENLFRLDFKVGLSQIQTQ